MGRTLGHPGPMKLLTCWIPMTLFERMDRLMTHYGIKTIREFVTVALSEYIIKLENREVHY